MAEVQEIDPLEELRLITEAWAEAHGMEAFVVIATKGTDEKTEFCQFSKGNAFTKQGLIKQLWDEINDYTQF